MARVITTAGIRSLGSYSGTVQAWLNSLTIKLYQNDRGTPLVTDSLSSYTICNFSGYADQAFSGWGSPTLDANNNDQYSCSSKTFTRSGGATSNQVYGWLAVDGAGNLCLVESNEIVGGVPMTGNGFTYTVLASFYSGQLAGPL